MRIKSLVCFQNLWDGRNLTGNKGFSSLEFIITLFFLSVLTIALGIFIRTSDVNVQKRTSDIRDKEKIDSISNTLLKEIKNDSTPDADSKFDSVWKYNDTDINGFHVSIKSLSSLINLNYINKDILLKTNFVNYFESPDSIKAVSNIIYERGLLYSYNEIKDFISEKDFNEVFTFYGYANFNVADEGTLKLIADDLTGSQFGDELINKRKILLHNKQFLQEETEFNLLCGIYYNEIYPFVNIKSDMNVNFMSEDTLRALLSYSGFSIGAINQKVNNLLILRNNREIREEDLYGLLGISKSDELYYYLGCRTWIWQILIEGEKKSCNMVLARELENSAAAQPKLFLIEKKWK